MRVQEEAPGYRIWGVDGVVYGPVELPNLIQWIQEDRVFKENWIFVEQEDIWRRAEQLPELQMIFSRRTASPPTADPPPPLGIKPGALRRVKILAGLSDEQLARFVAYMTVESVSQWKEIVRQGSPADGMYLVLDGEVRVRLMLKEREIIIATLSVGDFFGEMSLFDQGPRSADVVANTDAQLLKIGAAGFRSLVNEAPDLAAPFLYAVGKTLTARVRADNKRYRDSMNLGLAARS